MPPPVEPVDGDGKAMQFGGGYSSVERSGVSYMFAPEADGPRPVQRPREVKRIIGYAGHVPRDIRTARERSSAPLCSAVYATFSFDQ